MKIAVIADDLTGANDSGVQLTRFGLHTSVMLNRDPRVLVDKDAVVFDTDSRSLPEDQAYQKVKEISEFLYRGKLDVLFKKIDSTMRGNVGVEINAVYDVFQPDFVIIAPAFPAMGRKLINGYHYLHGQLLHETEVFHDPKTPVKESFLPKLLEEQTKRKIGHISLKELSDGYAGLYEKLAQFKKEKVNYVLFDAAEEEDLKRISGMINQCPYSLVWVGSAGLANVLPLAYGLQKKAQPFLLEKSDSPVLFVVGSVSPIARKQLRQVLEEENVTGLMMHSHLVVANEQARIAEMERVYREGAEIMRRGQNLVLYSSGERKDIELAVQTGKTQGMDSTEVSNFIAGCLGVTACRLIQNRSIDRMVLTGGDTAKQILVRLQTSELELLDEVEPGVPIGRIKAHQSAYVITKAGSFGSETDLLKSMKKLQGHQG